MRANSFALTGVSTKLKRTASAIMERISSRVNPKCVCAMAHSRDNAVLRAKLVPLSLLRRDYDSSKTGVHHIKSFHRLLDEARHRRAPPCARRLGVATEARLCAMSVSCAARGSLKNPYIRVVLSPKRARCPKKVHLVKRVMLTFCVVALGVAPNGLTTTTRTTDVNARAWV